MVKSQVPVRYHSCAEECGAIERRIEVPVTPDDHELVRIWRESGDAELTPLSQTLKSLGDGAVTHLGLTDGQAALFVISNVLMLGVAQNAFAWQTNVILSGPPGGGKSEVLNNVASCLPGSMVRHVDAKSRCVDLVAVPEDDMVYECNDELDLSSSTPADKQKQGETNARLARGWIVSSRAGLADGKLIRYSTIISARKYSFGCTNDALAVGRSALRDRSLLMFFGTRGEATTGPYMVARKSTKLAKAKRPVFEASTKLMHALAVQYWSIEAAGGIEINTENGVILQMLYAAKGGAGASKSREYGYEERIAIHLMVLEVITVWYKHEFGKQYRYSLDAFIYFARCHSTVGVHHFVQAAAMVRSATIMESEERDVMIGLKMSAMIPLVTDGPYIVLGCRPNNVVRALAPHTPLLGDGVRQEVVNTLLRRADSGMPVLDEHDGGAGVRLKLLIAACGVLVPAQIEILTELQQLLSAQTNPKWYYRYEEDGDHTKAYVFKPSVREAIVTPMMRFGAYSPLAIIAMLPHVHKLAIAFFELRSDDWYMSDDKAVHYVDNGVKRICIAPLVVTVKMFELLNAATNHVSDVGLQYGGRLTPGRKLYVGHNIPPMVCPPLATTPVTVNNMYYTPERVTARSRSSSVGGEMREWQVEPEIEEETPVSQDGFGISCSLFPPDVQTITLNPSVSGFEAQVATSHTDHTNGRSIPPEWANLETLVSQPTP